MVAPKDEHLALSSGIGLAGVAVTHFSDAGRHTFENFRSEIIDCIVKPNKVTAVHYYLRYLQDISKEIDNLVDNIDDMELVYDFILRTLDEVGMIPDLPEPNFYNCTNEDGHYECDCNNIIKQWIDFVEENENEIDELIIHSAFQIIFLDRKFLHDFHLELADFIEDYIDEIQEAYPENVTKKGRIKRTHFPKWLTSAVFYRDKGTCTICRCDLSNLIRTQNTIHIDHIVPLDVFGSNEASNFQLLCETCNTSKGARSTETSSINVPFWN